MPAPDPRPLPLPSPDPAVAAAAAPPPAPAAVAQTETQREAQPAPATAAEAAGCVAAAATTTPLAVDAEMATAPRSASTATSPASVDGAPAHGEAASGVRPDEAAGAAAEIKVGELGHASVDHGSVPGEEGERALAEHDDLKDDEEGAAEHEEDAQGEEDAEDADEVEDEEEDEEEDERFWPGMAERVIHVRSMHWSLRLITGFALGQLVAVALLIAVHGGHGLPGLHLPPVQVGWQYQHDYSTVMTTSMSLGIFLASFCFLMAAWIFVLSGAIHAQWAVRVLVLGIASYVFSNTPSPVEGLRTALLGLLWAWGMGVGLVMWREADLRGERPPLVRWLLARVPGLRRAGVPVGKVARVTADGLRVLERRVAIPRAGPFPLRTMAFVALWLIAYYGTLLASLNWGRGNVLFAATISLQLESLSFFLIPVLFLAGTDYAEVGEVLASRLGALARGLPSVWPLVALTAATAAVIVWFERPEGAYPLSIGLLSVGGQLVVGAALFGALALVARWGRVGQLSRGPLPYAALLAGTLLFIVLGIGGVQAVIARQAQPRLMGQNDYAVYSSPSAPHFSFVYPNAWARSESDDPQSSVTTVSFNGLASQYPGVMQVVSYPASLGDLSQALEAKLCSTTQCTIAPAISRDGWSERAFTRGGVRGWFWMRHAGSRMYFVVAFAPASVADLLKSSLDAVVLSWRPDHVAAVPPAPGLTDQQRDTLVQLIQVAMAAVALLAGLFLLWQGRLRRPRWRSALTASGTFMSVLGIVWLAFVLSPLAQLPGLPGHPLAFTLPSAQLVIAVATLLLVGRLLIRRRHLSGSETALVALVFALNVGLQLLAWISGAFDQSQDVKLSVGQAIILIIGIGWDVLMSGEQITNPDGTRFPRQVRLLLYLGYTMMVTTAVLYFTTQSFTNPANGTVKPFFEDAQWPQTGLIFLGAPLLITVFIIKVSRWWRGRERGQRQGQGHAAAEEEPVDASATPSAATASG